MIRFEHDSKVYGIQFAHTEPLAAALGLPYFHPEETRRVTTATIVDAVTLQELDSGISICHPIDSFVKEQGRRGSLTAALAEFPKSFRTAAWEAYFER